MIFVDYTTFVIIVGLAWLNGGAIGFYAALTSARKQISDLEKEMGVANDR